jgi:cholestenol delta-isomerase
MHLQNGLKIISRPEQLRINATDQRIPEDICAVFQELDLQAMSFADDIAIYPYENLVAVEMPPDAFSSIFDAMTCLIHNIRWIFYLASISVPNHISPSDLSTGFLILDLWDKAFHAFLNTLDEQKSQKLTPSILRVKMYYNVMVILVSVGVYGQECLFDRTLSEFEDIVTWGESIVGGSIKPEHIPTFSFEQVFILPLFFTAVKCRHPIVRRRAVALLTTLDSQEGSWLVRYPSFLPSLPKILPFLNEPNAWTPVFTSIRVQPSKIGHFP